MTAAIVVLPGLALWLALYAAVLVASARHAPRHSNVPAGAGGTRQPDLRCQTSTRSRLGATIQSAKIGTGAILQEVRSMFVPVWALVAAVVLLGLNLALDLIAFARRPREPRALFVVEDASDEDLGDIRRQLERQGFADTPIVSVSYHHRIRRLTAG